MADPIRYCILTTVPQGSVELSVVRSVHTLRGESLHSPKWVSNFNTLPAAFAYCRINYRDRGESISWEHDRERGRYLSLPALPAAD